MSEMFFPLLNKRPDLRWRQPRDGLQTQFITFRPKSTNQKMTFEVWLQETADVSLSHHLPLRAQSATAKCIIMTNNLFILIIEAVTEESPHTNSCNIVSSVFVLWKNTFLNLAHSLSLFSTHPDSFLIIFAAFCLSRQCVFLMWGLQRRAHLPLIQKPWSETIKARCVSSHSATPCALTSPWVYFVSLFVQKKFLNMYFSQR